MSYNPTVRQFKTDMQNLVNRAKQDLHQTLIKQGLELAENIRNAAPIRTGTLRDSVRIKDASLDDGSKLTVLVIAGGDKTTKWSNGHHYDYSVATEFGTHKENPEPFFYSSYRLYISHGLGQIDQTFKQTIEENNRMRANRTELSWDAPAIQRTTIFNPLASFAPVTHITYGGANLRNVKL